MSFKKDEIVKSVVVWQGSIPKGKGDGYDSTGSIQFRVVISKLTSSEFCVNVEQCKYDATGSEAWEQSNSDNRSYCLGAAIYAAFKELF